MRAERSARLTIVLALFVAAGADPSGYWFYGEKWPDGSVVMHLQLGSSSGVLIDGSADWGESAEAALALWNQYLDRVEFRVVRNSTAPIRDGDGVNNVFWSSTIYGRSFGDRTIAFATRWRRGSTRTEGDVVFNNTKSWNSYRGPLRDASRGGRLFDFRRVALHEFGHVLGLDHPDEHGQNVVAQMNSDTSDLDTLAPDDIGAAWALYGGGSGASINFPPRNESLDFRNQLEAKYRDGLRRSPSSSFVDSEGDVVWTQEYLRYRVNRCSHEAAVSRVILQIDGFGVPPVCGSASGGQVTFPPRNEPFDFRNQLEAKYRDDLRRPVNPTFVDVEGAIVWTQEYLRYRVNACNHTQAVDRVMQQIDGRGIPAVCR